eukprot:120531-Amphidinium_carterae.1
MRLAALSGSCRPWAVCILAMDSLSKRHQQQGALMIPSDHLRVEIAPLVQTTSEQSNSTLVRWVPDRP